DEAALTLFAVLPVALMVALDDHVHALHHVALRIVLERNDALETENVRSLGLRDTLDPLHETSRIHLTTAQGHRLYAELFDVIMVVMMVVIVIVIVVVMVMTAAAMFIMNVIMVMVMVMILRLQEMRIVRQHSVQVESTLVQDPV